MDKEIKVVGMSCSHCKSRVEGALKSLLGKGVSVDLASGICAVKNAKAVENDTIKSIVEALGYDVEYIKDI